MEVLKMFLHHETCTNSILLEKNRQRIVIRLLVSLVFTAYSGSANAQTTVNTFGGLQTELQNPAGANIVQLYNGTILFPTGEDAIVMSGTNRTIRGWNWNTSNFTTPIGNLSNAIVGRGSAIGLGEYRTLTSNLYSTFYMPNSGINALSTIEGAGRNVDRTRGSANASGDASKWFTTNINTPTAANGLNLYNVRFDNVDVEFPAYKYVNGLIGNHFQATTDSILGNITGNAFTQIDVSLKANNDQYYLAGGGIIGVRATGENSAASANAIVGEVSGNIFDGIKIMTTNLTNDTLTFGLTNSTYLEGGGLVGVNAASSPDSTRDVHGHAYMPKLANNFFTEIHILSNDILLGGGLVGLNNNTKFSDPSSYALLENAQGNIFGNGNGTRGGAVNNFDIKVEVGYSLRGGGVLGLNGLSSAEVRLDNLKNNTFAGISVETGTYIRGGGIVGLQTNDGEPKEGSVLPMQSAEAHLENALGNLFLNQQITAGTYLHGGGVIGLRGNMGEASLGTLKKSVTRNIISESGGLFNSVFKGIDVVVGSNENMPDNDTTPGANPVTKFLYGGGIVGVSGYDTATLTRVQDNYFEDLTVTVKSMQAGGVDTGKAELYGGGFIGADAYDKLGRASSEATIGYVQGNTFVGTQGKTNVDANRIYGGGIIGVSNDSGLAHIVEVSGNNIFSNLKITTESELLGGGVLGAWSNEAFAGSRAEAIIEIVDRNTFTGMEITVGGYLEGGGIIGARSNNIARIDEITNNTFTYNTIRANDNIDGGGIIGVTGKDGATNTGIGLIANSHFEGNNVSAIGNVMGGLVYSYGLTDEMIIRNSSFIDNILGSDTATVYGAVTVDTGTTPLPSGSPDVHTHTLMLEATGGKTTVFDNNRITDTNGVRYNSLYFGTIDNPDGSADPAEANAELIVQADGIVALYDPIWVNQDSGFTFDMEVKGGGNFIWGGANLFETDNETGTITLQSGSTTTILDGSSQTTYVNGQLQPMLPRYTMSLDAKNFTFDLKNGARLNVEGHNYFDLSGNDGSAGAPPVANLNGNLHFNLNNTRVYTRGELPDASGPGQALLTIEVPALGQDMVDLFGSTVSLSNVTVGGRYLNDGDRFYLIQVDNGITGDVDNKTFTDANPINGTANSLVTVSHGTTIDYKFIIDKNFDNGGIEENTRFLVARLEDVGPGGGFEPPDNGRITVLTFLQRREMPLHDFCDPCDSCNPCSSCGPCNPCDPCGSYGTGRRNSSKWIRTPFADIQGTWYRADTGSNAYADVRGAIFQGGLAVQKRLQDGRLYVGAFVDAGDGSYDTYNYVSAHDTSYRANGNIDSLGGGLLLRRKWNNGFRLDTMFRGGNVKNKFFSPDLIVNNAPVHYRMDNTYWGANIGLNYMQRFHRSTFDIYSRYGWLMGDGGRVVLSTTEVVDFKALHSHRLTSGGRWTVQRNSMLAWYLGAAYEHEFDGVSHAFEQQSGDRYAIGGSSIRGGTGIGELGLIMRPCERFYLTSGLEGYVGKRDGGSVFVAAMWRW